MNKFQEITFAGAAFGASIAGVGCSGDNPTQADLELRKCAPIVHTEETLRLLSAVAFQTFENSGEDISDYYERLRKDEFGSSATTIYTPVTCNRGPISRGNLIFDQSGEYQPVHVSVSGETSTEFYGSTNKFDDEDCIVIALVVDEPTQKTEDIEATMIDGEPVVYAACAAPGL